MNDILAADERKCNDCGTTYKVRTQGRGGSLARTGDAERFPFDERTHTGVKADNAHWFHGAFCSDSCYSAAYYEPPMPY